MISLPGTSHETGVYACVGTDSTDLRVVDHSKGVYLMMSGDHIDRLLRNPMTPPSIFNDRCWPFFRANALEDCLASVMDLHEFLVVSCSMRRVWAAERLSGIPAPIPGVVGESILWVGGGGREFEKVVRAVHLNAAPRGCEIESHRKGFQAGCVSKKSVKGKICTIEFFEQALGRWTLPLFRRAGW